MPICGSQVILCDVPIRFDTYIGCSHYCSYCFVQRSKDVFANVKPGEGAESLRRFINGERTAETRWCDWDIPLHWGGLSDPFQPAELKYKRSLEALKVFAETKYPFIVSTKNKIISEEPYLSLIKQCDCVVQFSAACDSYDNFEKGASTFRERLDAARKISPYKRVIIRCQPYIPKYFDEIKNSIEKFHEAGVYGVVFEGIKYTRKVKGAIKKRADFVFPSDLYKRHFSIFKEMLHKRGMRFYCGENRLRAMGDSLCCCGIDGLGWKPNTYNLNHYIYDKQNYRHTDAMMKEGSCLCFKCLSQKSKTRGVLKKSSFVEMMDAQSRDLSSVCNLVEDSKAEQLEISVKRGKQVKSKR